MTTALLARLAYVEGMLEELVALNLHDDQLGYRTFIIDEYTRDDEGRVELLLGTIDRWHKAAGSDDSFVRGQAEPAVIGEHEGFEDGPTNVDRGLVITERITAILAMRVQLKTAHATLSHGEAMDAYDHPLWMQSGDELTSLREQLLILV